MQHDTQRAMAPALHELLSAVSTFRDNVLAESADHDRTDGNVRYHLISQ